MRIKKRKFTGRRTCDITKREIRNREIARKAAAEGMVLLENKENVLPLKKGIKIGLYGAGAIKTVKGGTGSGDVNARDSISIYQGLKKAGYHIVSEDWLQSYQALYEEAKDDWKHKILEQMDGCEGRFFEIYTKNPFQMPQGELLDLECAKQDGAEICVFVLSRIAGENADMKDIPGEYYLTREERVLLTQISQAYERIVMIINTGNLIDLSFVDEFEKIKAVIFMAQAGQEGGNALADIISGDTTPSGKLTDSWAFAYEDYPNAMTYSHKNGNVLTEKYEEGIFVGYRYFDTFDVPVKYCFGHGLSYTKFTYEFKKLKIQFQENMVNVKTVLMVKNFGARYFGKEVLQLYVSCPQKKRVKEFRRLIGFCKTNELAPGEFQNIEITFSLDQLSSYDEETASWVLDAGEYGIWAGSSLEDSRLIGALQISADWTIQQCSNVCAPQESLSEILPDTNTLMQKEKKWKETLYTKNLPVFQIETDSFLTKKCDYTVVENHDSNLKRLVDSLSEEQLIALVTGDPEKGQDSMLGAAGITVPGSAAETSDVAMGEPWKIASIVLADGPAGLRLNRTYQVVDGQIVFQGILQSFEDGLFADEKEAEGTIYYQYCTAIPVGILLAQTWNTELLRNVGEMIGGEMEEFNISLWLAPGMNIHRNPLCGRNFEYYSEDPFLAGTIASNMTLGVQKVSGCGTTIKHFACNNQEDNRMNSDSVLSERTLRELYLKGFEIVVKKAQPMGIMTSYNMINGIHAANNYDLCTKIARNEWGFQGVIMTDWTTTTKTQIGECTASGCIRAGNDLIMPGMAEDHENIREALQDGTLSIEQLRKSVANIVRIIKASNQYEGAISYYMY